MSNLLRGSAIALGIAIFSMVAMALWLLLTIGAVIVYASMADVLATVAVGGARRLLHAFA
jgi:hypothetical protein